MNEVRPDPVIESIRNVRDEARRLENACLQVAETGTLLHVAFDQGLVDDLGAQLTQRLRLIQ